MRNSSETAKETTDTSATLNNLKSLRKQKKLTLEKLAKLSCLSPSYLSRLEVGTRRFNIDVLHKLSDILGCHPSDLIESNIKAPSTVKDLPIYGTKPNEEMIDFSAPLELGKRPEALKDCNTAFGVYLKNSTYEPKYMPGETIYLHPDRPLARGCTALAISMDEKIHIGQFEEWGKSNLILREFGEPRNFIRVPQSTLRVVYRIIGSIETL